MDGVIIINKPYGKTSHDMVYFIRKILNIKKVGHTGTLDPIATGVLPICIGKGTKAAEYLTATSKSYRAEIVLGMTTDTLDCEGEILTEQPICDITEEKFKNATEKFIGEIYQIPPMFSAIKMNGQKLYELARKGVVVEREKRQVRIDKIEIVSFDKEKGIAVIDVDCSKGTYIRTLCDDIGKELGCGAYMNGLIRTKSGKFSIEESYTTDEIIKLKEDGKLFDILIPVSELFDSFPKLNLSSKQKEKVINGVKIKYDGLDDAKCYRLFDEDGNFLAISQYTDGLLVLKKAFWI